MRHKEIDRSEIGVLVFIGVCLAIIIGIAGSLLAYDTIQEDCDLLNAFRIRGEVYSCTREYHYNESI